MLFEHKKWRKASIVGLGGIGKTQVARQLADWVKQQQPLFSIFWVPASSSAAFGQAFTEIARKLGIQNGDRVDDDDLKESVRHYLSSKAAGPWFLVVDNLDDGDVLGRYIPESDDGVTLFTTRSERAARSVTGNNVIRLQPMEPPEAADLLERQLISPDTAGAADLVEELGYLPLAITQVAAVLNEKQMPIPELLARMRRSSESVSSLLGQEFSDNTYSAGSMGTVFLTTFNQLRKSNRDAVNILEFLACIEPDNIPQSILSPLETEERLAHAVSTLLEDHLLKRDEDSGLLKMHRLVQMEVRTWAEREGRLVTIYEKAIRHLVAVFLSRYHARRAYIPHVFKVLQHTERIKELDTKDRSDLLFFFGRFLYEGRRITEAVRVLEQACAWTNRNLAKDDPWRLESQKQLAEAYTANSQIDRGLALLKEIVTIQSRVLPEDHRDRLSSQQALAEAYQSNGEVAKAIELLKQVVAIQSIVLGPNHPDRLSSHRALIMALASMPLETP